MIIRLDQIEVRLVLVVIAGDVRVRDVDPRSNLLVEQLLFCPVAPDLPLQIVQRQMLRVQPLLELLLCKRGLQLVQTVRDFLIRRHQILLGRPLHHDLLID
jgi:hypothetical protein